MKRYAAFLFLSFFPFFVHMNCSMLQLESTWKEREIVLDGKGGDWLGAKYYFEDSGISVGLINDERYLYVSVMTENPMVRAQIMQQGLTVWLDPKGGKNKTFGIKYPLGRRGDEQEVEALDPQKMMDEKAREEMMKKFKEAMSELEVLGPDERVLAKMDIEEAKGIIVRLRDAAGTFVYELRVPLSSSPEYPYAVGVEAGDVMGVGFLSPELEMRRPPGMGGRSPVPGGGMEGPGGIGGMPGMGSMSRFIPGQLKIWAKVQLASASMPALSFF
jgi:hypothetical protein